MKILFIAYACEPGAGSEYGVGWNVPLNMAMKYPDAEVYVVTRSRCKEKIDETLRYETLRYETPHSGYETEASLLRNDGAASAESNLFELCRVATEEDRRSNGDNASYETEAELSTKRPFRTTKTKRSGVSYENECYHPCPSSSEEGNINETLNDNDRTLPNPPLKPGKRGNLHFLFYDIPKWMYYKNEMKSRWGEQYNYILWQLLVRRKVKEWHRELHFDVIHHLTFNQYRTPSPGFFLDVPFVMGPIGGAETINPAFEQDLSSHTTRKERIRRRGWDLRLFGWWMRRKDNPKYVMFSTKENQERLAPYCGANSTEVYPAIGMESWPDQQRSGDCVTYETEALPPTKRPFGTTKTSEVPNDNDDLNDKAFTIIYAGKALDWKGVKLFLHAASKAFVEHGIESFRIKLVGIRFEEELRRVNEWIEEYKLKEHVEVIPFMERAKLLSLLSEAALSAYPAFRDSGSMSVLEASALGCPTICFDVGGQDAFPDDVLLKVPVVDDYNKNLQSFADRLHWAYSNPESLRSLGLRAKDYVSTNMTWEQKVEHYMIIYKGLIGLRPV